MASPNLVSTSRKLFQSVNNETTEIASVKRPVVDTVPSSQKKVKGTTSAMMQRPLFWLGFPALNELAKIANEPHEHSPSISELVKKGVSQDEAMEYVNSTPSFPFVTQEKWPSTRPDGKEGIHFNLTQIPHEVEVGEHGFALDYHISIHFEVGDRNLIK